MKSASKYLDSLRAWYPGNDSVSADGAVALGRSLLDEGFTPDQILALHSEAVEKAVNPNDVRGVVAGQHFLLEVMMAYGQAHRDRSESARVSAEAVIARERRATMDAEADARRHLEILAAVTHELGTPLTVVRGNVAVLRKFERPTDLLPSEIATMEADLDAAVDRMVALRERLLAANRDAEELELEPVLLDRRVERAARWAESAAREKGLEINLDLDCGDQMVSADEQALESILGNLLSNAIRYTPAGGTITCATRSAECSLIVDVIDTGVGMSEEEQRRVFDRFYRGEQAKKLSGFGLGLGLWLTKGLVEAMDATIAVQSTEGNGATFSIAFPKLRDVAALGAG